MFWLDRHLTAKQAIKLKQSIKGYERILRNILRRSGYLLYLCAIIWIYSNCTVCVILASKSCNNNVSSQQEFQFVKYFPHGGCQHPMNKHLPLILQRVVDYWDDCIMLVICLQIFVVRQQNKLFVIHEQKGDEQLFVKFNNFGSKLLDFFWKINSFFKNIFFKPDKFYEVQHNCKFIT